MKQELSRIQPMLESVIEAISSVVKVDITITDGALNRVASTGKYINNFDSIIEHESVFGYVLEHKKPLFIDNPRENEVCTLCKNKDNCKEYAEVCCPIILEDEIIGIIGLVAFDVIQEREMINNKEHLVDFLKSMAALIASKISEERQRAKFILQSREVDVLIDYIDRGVISINTSGKLMRFNRISNDFFNIENNNLLQIEEIISACKVEDLMDPSHLAGNHYFRFGETHNFKEFVYTGKPIFYENKVVEVVLSIRQTKKIINEVNALLGQQLKTTFKDILGTSVAIETVRIKGKKAANSTSTVLIQGESGTGKELFARAVHFESDRKDQAFVVINCAAIPENLLESELFGYEEGAFSGAKTGGKIGKFELADKGTLFLDEIGDMPIYLQAKILRILQERVVERVGGKHGIPIDVRIISATNKALEQLVQEGQFREDLFYRLNVIPLNIPSLRQRQTDIPLLVEYFIKRFNKKLNKNINGCNNNVLILLQAYPWKGNIRELENVIEYGVNMCGDEWIDIDDLPQSLKCTCEECLGRPIMKLKELEKLEIQRAIKIYGRQKDGVEEILKATGLSRATYYRKLKEYQL